MIRALHALGLKVAMISGDNRRTAEAIARRLGIDEVVAEVLPDGKVAAIKRLKALGPVAFVGDGINDAPALAEADLGLAIGTGTDVAIEAAEVVLMSGSLKGVPNAIAPSRATMRNIRHNLFWAFAYNAALIPVAVGALWPVSGTLPVAGLCGRCHGAVLGLRPRQRAPAAPVQGADGRTRPRSRLSPSRPRHDRGRNRQSPHTPQRRSVMTSSITVYSTATCPDCRALKAWLGRIGIPFTERDLTDQAVMDEAKRRFGVRVAPITETGDWFTYGTFEDQKPRIEAHLKEIGSWPI